MNDPFRIRYGYYNTKPLRPLQAEGFEEKQEESEFQPMFDSVESKLSGKKIGLFGSYGWGDGEWMRQWENQVRGDGAQLAADPVTAHEAPDDSALSDCRALGRSLA